MCGINGIYNFSGTHIPELTSLIPAMNEQIRHRGPDDHGIWQSPGGKAAFGHQRLSILDLSPAGHQPMTTPSGNAITYNGEIYNYQELKKHLPRTFKSGSDTEVLLYLCEKEGEHCIERLNGMFAFGYWDEDREELLLVRDRVGKKPLYYTTVNGVFIFSSEIKALLALPFVHADLDEDALYHFLTYSKLSPPMTMFSGIHKLPPGHLMKVDKNGINAVKPYWEVTYEELEDTPESELQDRIYNELDRAVQYRMVSDVPVGAFLSGGVDSSAIVGLMSQYTNEPVKTYSIGFDGMESYDELQYAREVSEMFGTSHYERVVTADDMRNLLPHVVDIFDEPMSDPTSIPIYFLSEMARNNGTKVILNGDGPDELFAGYSNWRKYVNLYPYYHSYNKLPSIVKKTAEKLYSRFNEDGPVYEILHRASSEQEFFWGGANGFKESVKRSFLTDRFNRQVSMLDSYEVIRKYNEDYRESLVNGFKYSDINWMCYLGFKNLVPNKYLYRADRLSMAHGVEARSPFLDYNFVNLALSTPGKYKVRQDESKYILKKSLERLLPDKVLYRKKKGFCVPLREWGGNIMIDYVEEHADTFCSNSGIFDPEGIKKLIHQVKNEKASSVNKLWNIYFLMTWFDRWM